MKAFEMFKQKYEEWLKQMPERGWKRIKEGAECKNMPIPDYMMMCLTLTTDDANPSKNADVYWELIQMNKDKLVASNRHRQYHGKIDAFWLTPKGLKEFNKLYNAE